MKIGIFGDSFAAYHDYNTSWTSIIKDKFAKGKLVNHAIPGTSHWFSYQKFLQDFQNYNIIIFCHTNSMRWPALPPGEHGRAWNIGYVNCPVMDPYNKIRKDIIPEELLYFISYNIFREVNRLCIENNKYLVNLLSFPLDFELPKTKFPVLIDLNQISKKEQVIYNGELKLICDLNSLLKRGDRRDSHLMPSNNKKLANIIIDLIKNEKYDVYDDLQEKYEWDIRDPLIDERYKKEYEYEKSISNRLLGLYRNSSL